MPIGTEVLGLKGVSHDFTCSEDVADDVEPEPDGTPPDPGCPSFPDWSGNGDNLDYHIPFCRSGPGAPVLVNPEPPGKVGCLKGWFVAYYPRPGIVSIGPTAPGADLPLTVTLIS